MQKIFYKVVSLDLCSAVVKDPSIHIAYKIKAWVHQPEIAKDTRYGLCVFSKSKSAHYFSKLHSPSRVFKCKVAGILKSFPQCAAFDPWENDIMKIIESDDRVINYDYQWPQGTIMVKSVKLVRETLLSIIRMMLRKVRLFQQRGCL